MSQSRQGDEKIPFIHATARFNPSGLTVELLINEFEKVAAQVLTGAELIRRKGTSHNMKDIVKRICANLQIPFV